MKLKINSLVKKATTLLLGLLGFASCEYIGIGLCMYGEPHADFRAIGSVTDDAGKPIHGIRVAIQQHRHYANTTGVIYDQNDWYDNDTVFTDSQGRYEMIRSVFEAPTDVTIVFEDIDGEENGGPFQKGETKPAVVRTKKGDNSWYGGAFEVSSDVKLKKAKD